MLLAYVGIGSPPLPFVMHDAFFRKIIYLN